MASNGLFPSLPGVAGVAEIPAHERGVKALLPAVLAPLTGPIGVVASSFEPQRAYFKGF